MRVGETYEPSTGLSSVLAAEAEGGSGSVGFAFLIAGFPPGMKPPPPDQPRPSFLSLKGRGGRLFCF